MTDFKKARYIIAAAVLVDVMGFGIVIPVLPFYVESFGATAKTVTLLFSVFALCSFLSAPVLGSLSDNLGRKPVFIASVLSTSLGWFVFAMAGTLPILFLGRIIDGLAAGNISTAQSYLVDISKSDKERTSNLGFMGATVGIGFIIGPLLGGLLSSISPTLPFLVTGILALANAFFAFFMLPESSAKKAGNKKIELNPFLPLQRAFDNEKLRNYFLAWFLFLLSIAGLQAIFALYVEKIFSWGSREAGFALAAMGAILVFNQGFVLKKFWLAKFKENQLILGWLVLCIIGFFIISFKMLILFALGLAILAFGQATLRIIILSMISRLAERNSQGETLGVSASIVFVASFIAPVISGFAFEKYDFLPFLLSAIYLIISFFVISNQLRKERIGKN